MMNRRVYIPVFPCIFMKKTFRKWGKSVVLSFNKEEQKRLGIKPGKDADLSDMKVLEGVKNE